MNDTPNADLPANDLGQDIRCETCKFYRGGFCKFNPPTPVLVPYYIQEVPYITQGFEASIKSRIEYIDPRVSPTGGCGRHEPMVRKEIAD